MTHSDCIARVGASIGHVTTASGGPEDSPQPHELSDEEARERLGIANASFDKKKTIILGIIAVVFLVIVFWRVIPQIGSYSEAVTYLENMTWQALTGLVCMVLLYLFIYGWPFVASTPGLKYKQGFIVNQSAFTVSNGVPAGGVIGLGLQYAQLTSYKATPTVSTASIGATGVWSVFITLFLPVTGVLAMALSGGDASKYRTAALVGILVLVVAVGLFALILRSEKNAIRIGKACDKVLNACIHIFKKDKSVDVTSSILQLRVDIVDLVKARWFVITIAQIAVSWCQFLILWAALVGVSGQSGTIPILAAYGCWAVSQLGILVPITPGGLGTVDAVLISLLVAAGVSEGAATAADLVWRASSYVPQICIGLICIFYWRFDLRRQAKKDAAAQVSTA